MISKNRPHVGREELFAAIHAPPEAVGNWERAMAHRCGAQFALAFPYNRVGIYASLVAHGWHNRDVLVPAYNCTVVAAAVVCSGNRPVFVDIDPTTYGMAIEDAARKRTQQTVAAIPTWMYGDPYPTADLAAALGDDVLMIEDVALASPGFSYQPAMLQHDGVAIFSFDLNKLATTGNGGILLTNDREIYEKLDRYREQHLHAPGLTQRLRTIAAMGAFMVAHRPAFYGFADRFRKRSPWIQDCVRAYSTDAIRMDGDWEVACSPAQGAVGLQQLDRLDHINAARMRIAERYQEALEGTPGLTLPSRVDYPRSHFTVRVRERDRFRDRMYDAGVECGRTLDYCLPDLDLYRAYGQHQTCPEATRAAAEIVNLPCYPALTTEDVDRVVHLAGACLAALP